MEKLHPISEQHFRSRRRLPAGVRVLAAFVSLSLVNIMPLPSARAGAAPPADLLSAQSQVIVPARGEIEETHRGTGKKTIIYIQDAHASLEAQENIAAIISDLVENRGVRTVFEEGYEGDVPTDEFFGFMDDPMIRRKVSHFFLDKLRVGAAEYAHINRARDFRLLGADSFELHTKNIEAYRKTAEEMESSNGEIDFILKRLRLLANRRFPEKIKGWIKWKERYEHQNLDLLNYLRRTADIYRSQKGEDSLTENFPVLNELLLIASAGSGENGKEFNSPDPARVFDELKNMEAAVINAYLSVPADLELFEHIETLDLFERLNRLTVGPSEYQYAARRLASVDTKELASFAASETQSPILFPRRWEKSIRQAVKFYRAAEARDTVLETSLRRFLSEPDEDTAIVVYGGFHKDKIREIMRRMEVSYLIIRPRITHASEKHEAYYQKLMTQGHYDFEAPYLVSRASRPGSLFTAPLSWLDVSSVAKTAKDFPDLDEIMFEKKAEQRLAARSDLRGQLRDEETALAGISIANGNLLKKLGRMANAYYKRNSKENAEPLRRTAAMLNVPPVARRARGRVALSDISSMWDQVKLDVIRDFADVSRRRSTFETRVRDQQLNLYAPRDFKLIAAALMPEASPPPAAFVHPDAQNIVFANLEITASDPVLTYEILYHELLEGVKARNYDMNAFWRDLKEGIIQYFTRNAAVYRRRGYLMVDPGYEYMVAVVGLFISRGIEETAFRRALLQFEPYSRELSEQIQNLYTNSGGDHTDQLVIAIGRLARARRFVAITELLQPVIRPIKRSDMRSPEEAPIMNFKSNAELKDFILDAYQSEKIAEGKHASAYFSSKNSGYVLKVPHEAGPEGEFILSVKPFAEEDYRAARRYLREKNFTPDIRTVADVELPGRSAPVNVEVQERADMIPGLRKIDEATDEAVADFIYRLWAEGFFDSDFILKNIGWIERGGNRVLVTVDTEEMYDLRSAKSADDIYRVITDRQGLYLSPAEKLLYSTIYHGQGKAFRRRVFGTTPEQAALRPELRKIFIAALKKVRAIHRQSQDLSPAQRKGQAEKIKRAFLTVLDEPQNQRLIDAFSRQMAETMWKLMNGEKAPNPAPEVKKRSDLRSSDDVDEKYDLLNEVLNLSDRMQVLVDFRDFSGWTETQREEYEKMIYLHPRLEVHFYGLPESMSDEQKAIAETWRVIREDVGYARVSLEKTNARESLAYYGARGKVAHFSRDRVREAGRYITKLVPQALKKRYYFFRYRSEREGLLPAALVYAESEIPGMTASEGDFLVMTGRFLQMKASEIAASLELARSA